MDRWLEDSELWSLVLAADVLVLPCLRASQSGLVPLALRAGVPVIATDAGGLAERGLCWTCTGLRAKHEERRSA